MAEEQGLEVSIDGFNKCMDQQRERSRVSLHLQCKSHPQIVRRTCFRTQWTVLVVALFVLPCVWPPNCARQLQSKAVSNLVPSRDTNTTEALLSIDSNPEIVKTSTLEGRHAFKRWRVMALTGAQRSTLVNNPQCKHRHSTAKPVSDHTGSHLRWQHGTTKAVS